jgi:hypothetical protein
MKLQGIGNISPQDLSKVVAKLDDRAKILEQTERTISARDVYAEAAKTQDAESPGQNLGLPSNLKVDDRLKPLLDRLQQAKQSDLTAARSELRATKTIADEIYYLSSMLRDVTGGTEAKDLALPSAQKQWSLRAQLLKKVEVIQKAIEASGVSEAAKKFPVAQVEALYKTLGADKTLLEEAHGERVKQSPVQPAFSNTWAQAPQLPPADPMFERAAISTLEGAGGALAKILEDEGLKTVLADAAKKVGAAQAETFQKNVTAFTQLADSATSALDYRKDQASWVGPMAREHYRLKKYDGYRIQNASERQNASKENIRKTLAEALKQDDPAKAVETALVAAFLPEIGVTAAQSKDWNMTAGAIRAALDHELLFPLRALNERTVAGISMKFHGRGLEEPGKQALDAILQHVLEGSYEDWIYTNPVGAQQLSAMSDEQRAKWRADHSTTAVTQSGRTLTTREEGGLDTFWITKIGGPSHGFDMFSHCLLPVVSNARSKAILVDDPDYSHAATARAYLRALSFSDSGKPLLYLEPIEPDKYFKPDYRGMHDAVIKHAVEKAQELGVALVINGFLARHAIELGFSGKPDSPRMILEASNGLFEASDTLISSRGFHDWVQMEREVVTSSQALVIEPK